MATTFTSYAHLQGASKLAFEADENVIAVLNFMQSNMQLSKMVATAEQVAKIAPLLWGHHSREEVSPIRLHNDDKFEETIS